MTPHDQDFLDFVLDQLGGLRAVSSRRMFGAIGLYQGDHFFAIIDEGRLYFLTGDATRGRYEAMGTKPFEYAPGKLLRSYYEVPVDVIEDDSALCAWAREAVEVQAQRRTKRRRRGGDGRRDTR